MAWLVVSGPSGERTPEPAPFGRVTASDFDGFRSGHSAIGLTGQWATRKVMP